MLFKYGYPFKDLHHLNHFLRIYLNRQGLSRQTVRKSLLYAKDFAFKSLEILLLRGKHPVLVSGFSLIQQFPTVCPNCAGVVSTIGLRSFLPLSQRDWISFDPLLYFLGFWL